MIDTILKYIAPHHCCGCDEIGSLLCQNCKYDITSESFEACVACGTSLVTNGSICVSCKVPYSKAWCVGGRQGTLEKLIDVYKFSNAKAAHMTLADLLHDRLPDLPEDMAIVPVPTVSTHIRQRGYDHTLLLAKRVARLRGLQIDTSLQRASDATQRGSSRSARIKQAKAAYTCTKPLENTKTYLLLDDVVTTGATVKYAAKALRNAGAGDVWVGTISRQTLD